MTVAEERLKRITGLGGSPSPEVPAEILRRDVEILGVGQVGHRASKYGVIGLDILFKAVGEATKSEPIKAWSWAISRGTGATVSILALLLLRGRVSRELAFGATWENLTAGLDYVEDLARKALGVK